MQIQVRHPFRPSLSIYRLADNERRTRNIEQPPNRQHGSRNAANRHLRRTKPSSILQRCRYKHVTRSAHPYLSTAQLTTKRRTRNTAEAPGHQRRTGRRHLQRTSPSSLLQQRCRVDTGGGCDGYSVRCRDMWHLCCYKWWDNSSKRRACLLSPQ